MTSRGRYASIPLSASTFATAGAMCRHRVRTIETRYQIAAFVGGAIGVELVVGASRLARPSRVRGVASAAAATLAIVLVKFRLEPAARARDAAAVRHAVRSVAGAVRNAR